jgi:hypothetical protein
MLEREGKRKYFREIFGAFTLYGIVLFGANTLAGSMEPGAPRTLLLVSPMIPLLLAAWAIVRHLRRVDEFVRLRTLESIGVAAGITACWTLTYSFLEGAGFPRLGLGWVWIVMGAVWGLDACLRGRVYGK